MKEVLVFNYYFLTERIQWQKFQISNVDKQAVIRLFNALESASAENKMSILSIASGRDPKLKLEQVRDKLPEMVEKLSRNLKPILHWLDIEYNIKI